jgi:hypothetical protein
MKRILILCAVVGSSFASAIFAFGDLARPKPSPAQAKSVLYTSLEVRPDSKIYEARLQISAETLKQIATEAGESSSGASTTRRLMQSSSRTMVAGLFMFLSISFAGIWLARSGQRRNHKAVIAAVGVAACLGLATMIVRANAGPPASYYWQHLPENLKQGKPTQAGVSIEIVPGDESTIKLLMPIKNKTAGEE